MNNFDKKLTALQAYYAMREYIEGYAERTSSDDLLIFLKELKLSKNGVTINPVFSYKWCWCVERVVTEGIDYSTFYPEGALPKFYKDTKSFPEKIQDPKQVLTYLQGLHAARTFLEIYYSATGSDSAGSLAGDMSTFTFLDGETADPAAWGDWLDAIEVVLKKDNSSENASK